jgi:hypothetical protein
MKIIRQSPYDGRFEAPIAVNVRLTFVPISGVGEAKSLTRSLVFAPNPAAVWAHQPGTLGRTVATGIRVDSNGDKRPDLDLPGTSNFAAGWRLTDVAKGAVSSPGFDATETANYTVAPIRHCNAFPNCTKEHETTADYL